MRNRHIPVLFMCFVLVLSACNMPGGAPATQQNSPNAVFTAAAQTVEAKLTQDARLLPTNPPATVAVAQPTSTSNTQALIPTATTGPQTTAAPTSTCDTAQFLTDVTIPDGTSFNGGESFIKTWRLKNTGTCTWDTAYTVVFDTGDAMSGPASISLSTAVSPGQQIDVSIPMVAPSAEGKYRGYWRLRNGAGVFLPIDKGYNGKSFYVEIQVKKGSADSGGGKFAITGVVFNVTRDGSCASGKYIVTATITTNKGGHVTYTWVRSDGATGPSLSGSLDFDNAGSKTVSFEWTTSASGLGVDLYIDNPNHQNFPGPALNCP